VSPTPASIPVGETKSNNEGKDTNSSNHNGHLQQIKDTLSECMSQQKSVWISYNGGGNPGKPRCVAPLKWIRYPILFAAMCKNSNTEKNFSTSKVLEIREEQWTVETPVTPNTTPVSSTATTTPAVATSEPASTPTTQEGPASS
jgi:hypothetical protein